ncbi:MAG: T9SS type A sorting domain-containing protein, partial [bacterium]
TYNSAIGTLPTVTRSGYSFVAWKIGAEVITDATVWRYVENQTAVAEWQQSVVTAADEVNYQDLVSVYPNPANEYIFVEASFDAKLIRIYDTRGALVNSTEPQGTKTAISVANLTDGVYIVEIVASDNKVVRTKFIKL